MKERKVEKQKKHNYKIIIGLLLGLAIGSIGVYAAAQIASSNVTYTNNSQSTVSGALDDLFSKVGKCPDGKTCLNHELKYLGEIKLGDYVKMTPTSTSYTIPKEDTGYTEDQTINPSELNIWRIININDDGTADAVSEYVSSTGVYFKGQTGYQKYIGTLNTIANQYQNSSYTTKARHMGSAWGQTSEITDTSKITQSSRPWTASTSSSTTPADEVLGAGDMGYEYDYNLVTSVLGSVIANQAGTTTATKYWLASRICNTGSSRSWNFSGRAVSINGNLNINNLYGRGSSSGSYSISKAIRPIITLKAGLTTSGGDGKSETTAWTFS